MTHTETKSRKSDKSWFDSREGLDIYPFFKELSTDSRANPAYHLIGKKATWQNTDQSLRSSTKVKN
jgi:hypothetical protein